MCSNYRTMEDDWTPSQDKHYTSAEILAYGLAHDLTQLTGTPYSKWTRFLLSWEKDYEDQTITQDEYHELFHKLEDIIPNLCEKFESLEDGVSHEDFLHMLTDAMPDLSLDQKNIYTR